MPDRTRTRSLHVEVWELLTPWKRKGPKISSYFYPFRERRPLANNKEMPAFCILDSADQWMMEVDMNGRPTFPGIVQTSLRKETVLWSQTKKKFMVVELTVPWEDRCSQD